MLLTLTIEFVIGALFVLLCGWIIDCVGDSVEAILSKFIDKTEAFAGEIRQGFISNPYPVRMGYLTVSIFICLMLM